LKDRIKLLSDDTSKRIAAGEVITGPAAVVKELVENSIDAGAGNITIEIADGGKELIRVSDNGSGIHSEDMLLAVQKHATSKISGLNDLGSISTLGFRGEALASMAAVSRLTISSRMRGSGVGSVLTVNGGGAPFLEAAGLPDGTTVKVENLFFNVPARKKFMKTAGREAAQVSDVVSRLILSHPEISIKYLSNGKLTYSSPGNGKLRDSMIAVFGMDIADKVLEVGYGGTTDMISINGYITKPSVLYKTSKNMIIFLNGRYIQSKQVNEAIIKGYGERLLRSHYPLCVLELKIPYANVDVNVHPGKLQVMFYDADSVMEGMAAAVESALA
jgi:DNA mismatch repair protein MutL